MASGIAPVVEHAGQGPTGHAVTFRYANPSARAVFIKGEWSFGRPSAWPQLAGTPTAYATLTGAQTAALRTKSVFIGGGWQDPIHDAGYQGFHRGTARQISTFVRAGIPLTTSFVQGGHNWHVWRQLLRDFLTRVAFLPRPFAHWE